MTNFSALPELPDADAVQQLSDDELSVCPTRIRVLNVPTPESGHRFGDVVLHDGDTVGTRQLADGEELGVFNEIALWERSPLSTLTATVEAEARKP